MTEPVDRALIESLLEDESLSFREIVRRARCSDWTVRSIARSLSGDDRPMKRRRGADDDTETQSAGWQIVVGLGAVLAGIVWLATRRGFSDRGPMR
jgi:hypothetical protein